MCETIAASDIGAAVVGAVREPPLREQYSLIERRKRSSLCAGATNGGQGHPPYWSSLKGAPARL